MLPLYYIQYVKENISVVIVVLFLAMCLVAYFLASGYLKNNHGVYTPDLPEGLVLPPPRKVRLPWYQGTFLNILVQGFLPFRFVILW